MGNKIATITLLNRDRYTLAAFCCTQNSAYCKQTFHQSAYSQPNSAAEQLIDQASMLQFRHLLEGHGLGEQIFAAVNQTLGECGLFLRAGTIVDASLIVAPTSTKNQSKARDVEMHASKKGNQWFLSSKFHKSDGALQNASSKAFPRGIRKYRPCATAAAGFNVVESNLDTHRS